MYPRPPAFPPPAHLLPAKKTIIKTPLRRTYTHDHMLYAEKHLLLGGTHPQQEKYTYDPVAYAKQLLLGGITHPNPGEFMHHPVAYAVKLLLWALERADRRRGSTVSAESSPGQAGGEGPASAAFSAGGGSAAFGW